MYQQPRSSVGVFSPRAATKLRDLLQRPVPGLDLTQTPGQRAAPDAFFPVFCTVDGGSVGSPSTNCTLTYTLKAFDGGVLGTARTPATPRYTNTIYNSPAANSIGVGYIALDGTVQLLWVPAETEQVGTC